MLNKKIIDAAEKLGWSVNEYDDGTAEFSQFSPAGEDFSFCVPIENVAEEVKEYYNDFDIDEHIEMWIAAKNSGVSGVPSIQELCDDAEKIGEMLEDLAIAVAKIA